MTRKRTTKNVPIPAMPDDPSDPAAADALDAWRLDLLETGHKTTGNGFFPFLALHWILEMWQAGREHQGIPPWVLKAFLSFGDRLAGARSHAEIADALGMRDTRPHAPGERVARWLENAFRAALVQHAKEIKGAPTHKAALDAVVAFLQEEGDAVSHQALRKSIERLNKPQDSDGPLPESVWPPRA